MRTLAQLLMGLVLLAAAQAAVAAEAARPANQDKSPSSAAELALQRAAKEKQHLFLLVYEKQDEATNKTQQTVMATVKALGKQAQWLAVERDAAANKTLVEKEVRPGPRAHAAGARDGAQWCGYGRHPG